MTRLGLLFVIVALIMQITFASVMIIYNKNGISISIHSDQDITPFNVSKVNSTGVSKENVVYSKKFASDKFKTYIIDDSANVINLTNEYPKVSKEYPKSCLAYENSSAIHTIQVPGMPPFDVACDARLNGSGWTVIQRRVNGDLGFYRNWTSYKTGFGNLDSEFFIGLDKLHAITNDQLYEIYVYLEDFEGNNRYARYNHFEIGHEYEAYVLRNLGSYSGTAGDALQYNNNTKFTTLDRDNDNLDTGNIAVLHTGAWWYGNTVHVNLNGLYMGGDKTEKKIVGISWFPWHGYYYSLKYVQIMIRPSS